jgi:outer membrane protein assembly factor BamD
MTYTQLKPYFLALTAILLFALSACDTPEKVLKSNDLEYKKVRAIEWYNKKEYVKCIPVFEELIGLMKGKESTEELYYYYCMANYKQGDFLISSYHFKNFFDLYPNSTHGEEALYLYARSNYEQAPRYDLDPSFTYKALEAYTLFFSMFPDSKYLNEANEQVSKLRQKLERKALSNADLYYRTSNFKAAATSFANLLTDYPDIDDNERIMYMIVKADYKFAQNSIASKKSERYKVVLNAAKDFKYKYPQSKLLADAESYSRQARVGVVLSAFEWADTGPLNERERLFKIALKEAELNIPLIEDKDQAEKCTEWIEKGYFLIVKNNLLLSENVKQAEKEKQLKHTIETYYTFAEKYGKGKYAKQAEKLFDQANERLNKIINPAPAKGTPSTQANK